MKKFGCGIKLLLGVLLLVVTIATVYSESHSSDHVPTEAHEAVRGETNSSVISETTNQEPKTEMSSNGAQFVQLDTARRKTESEKLWYRDANAIAAVGSIGAVIMSVFALFVSRQGQVAQQLREKHEELRGVLEKLISLREEFAQINRLKYDTEKSLASSYMNAKRAVYLEDAEALAKEIPKQVSASEYHVIGIENYFDSDFVQARVYYRLAVQYSQSSSAYKQSEILRSLGATYFIQDHAMLDVQEGRKYFKQSIKVLEGRTDYYSSYTKALCYRDFAYSELLCKNYDDVIPLLNESYNEWLRIPESSGFLRGPDLITIANYWRALGEGYYREIQSNRDQNIEKGTVAFKKELEILQLLEERYGIRDDYIIDTQGLIYQEWGQQEINAGFEVQGTQLLDKAKESFMALSDNYMWRATRQLGINSLLLQAARQDMEKQTVIGQTQEPTPLGSE